MEDRSQRISAVNHGMKHLARRVQGRSFTTASFREPISQHSPPMSQPSPQSSSTSTAWRGLGIDEDSAVLGSVRSQFQAPYGAREVIRGVHGNNILGGKSLLDCMVFGRVTGVACARYLLGDKAKAISLAALASGVSVQGSESDQGHRCWR